MPAYICNSFQSSLSTQTLRCCILELFPYENSPAFWHNKKLKKASTDMCTSRRLLFIMVNNFFGSSYRVILMSRFLSIEPYQYRYICTYYSLSLYIAPICQHFAKVRCQLGNSLEIFYGKMWWKCGCALSHGNLSAQSLVLGSPVFFFNAINTTFWKIQHPIDVLSKWPSKPKRAHLVWCIKLHDLSNTWWYIL